MNIAVFASGKGTNLQSLIDAEKSANLAEGHIRLVISDKKDAYALIRAAKAEINTFVLESKECSSREEYEKKLMIRLKKENIDLIVLAGFMRILSADFVEAYKGRIINIHPALLPSFKGMHGIKDAFDYGVKITGVTVHFVDKEIDEGPIILQKSILVEDHDNLETLEEKVHKEEHVLYPLVVKLFVEGRLKIEGRKVRIAE
ncbi:MAG: phosphoribosylglycinamide formyltransferase [Candidatus Omnitrophota bacterium]